MCEHKSSKEFDDLLGRLKGCLLQEFSEEEALFILKWTHKSLVDTIKDRKEKIILKELKTCIDPVEKAKLIERKESYLPDNYPKDIRIGDVVHINFGFGFCSELSDGHYAIVMSDIVANMYLIIPLSSEPLRKFPFHLNDLKLPNKERIDNKCSHLRFDQMRCVHYRRIEKIKNCERKNIGEFNILKVYKKMNEFQNFSIDNFS